MKPRFPQELPRFPMPLCVISDHIDNPDQKYTVFGMGKIGRNTCENQKHTQNDHIVLINEHANAQKNGREIQTDR